MERLDFMLPLDVVPIDRLLVSSYRRLSELDLKEVSHSRGAFDKCTLR